MNAASSSLFAMCLLLAIAVAAAAPLPEQVHLGPGLSPDKMQVGWVTPYSPSATMDVVEYGASPQTLRHSSIGEASTFLDGAGFRNITMHHAEMVDLLPTSQFFYRVCSSFTTANKLCSEVFSFRTLPQVGPQSKPLKFLLFGDMGADNPQSLPAIIKEVEGGQFNLGVGLGDFAYDMQELNGTRADDYFRANQPVYAALPWIVCPGNHEGAYNFQHYTRRWNTDPSNTGVLPDIVGPRSESAQQPNNWWFSFDAGNVHFLSIDTELWFKYPALVKTQLEWMEKDLAQAQANRETVPWIIVYGHRSVYCSCDGDCVAPAEKLRKDIEPLLYKFGVDLFINAHEHNYERMYAIHNNTYMAGNGSLVSDPAASVYVVTGDAGNREGHEPFTMSQPKWSAFRSNTYGYARMEVHNSTHLLWEQVMTDEGQPKADYGKVIDSFWLVQNDHGPFGVRATATAPLPKADPLHSELLSSLTGLDGPGHKWVESQRTHF